MIVIELYTTENCHLCTETKQYLNEQSLSYIEYKIGTDITRKEVKEKFPGVAMLPVMVVDGTIISNPKGFKLLTE